VREIFPCDIIVVFIINHKDMDITIITSNLQYAKFIQKAFVYENLRVKIISIEAAKNLSSSLGSDAFLFYMSDPREEYKPFCDFLNPLRDKCVVALMTDSYVAKMKRPWIADSFDIIFYKPFSFLNIALNIKQKLSEIRSSSEIKELKFDDVTLNFSRREAFFKDKRIFLRNKEFSLLQYFLMNKNKVLTRPDILSNVWDYNANILTNTVDVHVSRLRRKLKICASMDLIKTVPCVGYIYDSK